jgi:Transposase IS66 family
VHLHALLRDYRGIVQCDGYAPYKQLPDDAFTLAFCWAHVRRGFFEIARKGNAPIATQALVRIAALTGGRITDRRAKGAAIKRL